MNELLIGFRGVNGPATVFGAGSNDRQFGNQVYQWVSGGRVSAGEVGPNGEAVDTNPARSRGHWEMAGSIMFVESIAPGVGAGIDAPQRRNGTATEEGTATTIPSLVACLSPAGAGSNPTEVYVGMATGNVPIHIYIPSGEPTSGRGDASDAVLLGGRVGGTAGYITGGTIGLNMAVAAGELPGEIMFAFSATGAIYGALIGGAVGYGIYQLAQPNCF